MMSLFRDPAQLSGADARKCRPRSVEWSPARFACAVFTHIECAVRYFPTEREGPFNPRMLEDAFPMRDVAGSGGALELNIDSPKRAWILRSGGARTVACITSASDAHTTRALAASFYEAMAMAEHFGFRPVVTQRTSGSADSAQ